MEEISQENVKVTFPAMQKEDFLNKLKKRVEAHFKERGIAKSGDFRLWIKTALIFALFLFSYGMILSNAFSGWALLGWYTLLGFAMGLTGFNFCHDVVHGAYFASPKWNRIFSYVFDLNGESSYVWRVSHNYRHHTYTNIPGQDDDINKAILLRLSPTDKIYPFHRFQHIYAIPLYAFTTLNWVLYSDYKWFFEEWKKNGIPRKEIVLFFLFKALNLTAFLLFPLYWLSAPAWQVILGFIFMHFSGGSTISLVFQLAHLVEGLEFPRENEEGKITRPWAEHELRTTSDFATDSRFWAFWLGGLNYQVEHHLFPYVSHIHYPDLCPILKRTAEEFNIPYHSKPTLSAAIYSHLITLRELGTGRIN